MQAVITAAGKGTRMKPLTYKTPKAMLPLKGRPILEYTIDFLPSSVNEIIITVNHLRDQIISHFGDEYKGRKIKYVVHEKLDGTGAAVHECRDLIKEKFLVIMGDDIYHRDDLEKMARQDLAVLSYEVEDSSQFGVLKIDENGNLIEIMERPHPPEYKLVNTAAYTLNKKFFDYDLVPISDTEFGLPQTLAVMAKDYPVKILKASKWQTIGNPDDYKKAEKVIDEFLK